MTILSSLGCLLPIETGPPAPPTSSSPRAELLLTCMAGGLWIALSARAAQPLLLNSMASARRDQLLCVTSGGGLLIDRRPS